MNSRLPALLLLVFNLFLSPVGAADKPVTKKMRLDEFFSANTNVASEKLDEANWMIFNLKGRLEAMPETPAALITLYRADEPKRTRNGIIVFSNTHSIPDTKAETESMGPQLAKLYRLKEWREAENKLVEALVAEANKEGIPVWVNATRYVGNRLATFQLLTDPKLILKK